MREMWECSNFQVGYDGGRESTVDTTQFYSLLRLLYDFYYSFFFHLLSESLPLPSRGKTCHDPDPVREEKKGGSEEGKERKRIMMMMRWR